MTKKTFILVSILTTSLFFSLAKLSAQELDESIKDEFELFEELNTIPEKNNQQTQAKTQIQNKKQINESNELKKAILLVKENKKDQAIQYLWQNINKLNNESIFYLADLHYQMQEPVDTIKALNIIIARDDKNDVAYAKIGDALMLNKKDKEAMEAYKNAIEINRKNEQAYSGLIKIYEKKKNLYELRILYQDMIQNIGHRALFSEKLCEINTKDQIYEPAIRDCKIAIRLNDKACDAYVYLGLAYKSTGDDKLSVFNLLEATKKCPNSEFALFTYAKHLEDKKNYLEAYKLFQQCSSTHQENGSCWLGLAKTAFELKNNEQSVQAYIKACQYSREQAAASLRRTIQVFRTSKNAKDSEKFEAIIEKCSL